MNMAERLDGKTAAEWKEKAKQYYDMDNYFKAIECYEKAGQLTPKDNDIWFWIGKSYDLLNNFGKAADFYFKATQIAPSPVSLNNCGWMLYRKGSYVEALGFFQRAVDLDPGFLPAINNMGLAYNKLMQSQNAFLCFDQAIKINPKDAKAYNNKGVVYQAMGNKAAAIEFYEKAVELDTNFLIARKNLLQYKESKKTTAEDWNQEGRAYLDMKKFKEAINCFKKATQLNPKERRYWFLLGLAFYRLDRCSEAIAYYIKANEIAPESETFNNLALCYKNLKQFDKATETYEAALRLKPEDHMVLNNLGDNYYNQHNFPKALEYFQRSVEVNPLYALGWYNVGRVYTKLGDRSKTLDCWVRGMSIDPNLGLLKKDLADMLIAHPHLKLELPPLEQKYGIQITVTLKISLY